MDGYDLRSTQQMSSSIPASNLSTDAQLTVCVCFYLGFYLFHESMLESVIYARDHFLAATFQSDEERSEKADSILIFPSHAYLVSSSSASITDRLHLLAVLCSVRR